MALYATVWAWHYAAKESNDYETERKILLNTESTKCIKGTRQKEGDGFVQNITDKLSLLITVYF